MRLNDKVAIVTGGAHGMGEAEARLFAREGARVVVADILASAAEAVAADIRAGGGQAIAAAVDVTSEAAWRTLIDQTLSTQARKHGVEAGPIAAVDLIDHVAVRIEREESVRHAGWDVQPARVDGIKLDAELSPLGAAV